MAKKDTVFIDVQTSDGGSMQRVAVSAKKLGIALDDAGKASGKTGKSARTLDRNLKGTADMTSNATKGFSKMAQGMTGTLVPAYAVLASNVFAITAAFNFLRQAADFRVMQDSQVAFTGATGVGMQSLTKNIQEASGAMLDFKTAGESAAIGIASGLGSGQIEALAAGAGNLSKILGRDVTDSFNRLVRGVTKAEPELLDELGITLRLADAQENYAATLGKSAKDLTTYEKKQAVFAEVQGQLERKYNAVAKATDVQANAISKLGVAFDKVTKVIKGYVNAISEPVAEFFTKNVNSLAAALALLAVPIVRAIIPGLDNWKEKSQEAAGAASRAYEDAREELEELEQQQRDMAAGKPITSNITQSAGLQKAGGNIDKLNKQQTAQLLRNATRENKRLKNLSDKQLSTYRIMLKSKLRGHTTWVEKIILQYNNMGQRMDVANKKMVARWKVAMAAMQGLAAKFTRGVDLLFKGLGLVGIVLMVKDLGKEVLQVLGFFKEDAGVRKFGDEIVTLRDQMEGVNKEFKNFSDIQATLRKSNAASTSGRSTLDEFEATGRMVSQTTPAFLKNNELLRDQDALIRKAIDSVKGLKKEDQERLDLLNKFVTQETEVTQPRGDRPGKTITRAAFTADAPAALVKEYQDAAAALADLNKKQKVLDDRAKLVAEATEDFAKNTAELRAEQKIGAVAALKYFRSFAKADLTTAQEEYMGYLKIIESGKELLPDQAEKFKKLGEEIAEVGTKATFSKQQSSALETQYNTVISSVKLYKTANSDLIKNLKELREENKKLAGQRSFQGSRKDIDDANAALTKQIQKLERMRDIEIGYATQQRKIQIDQTRALVGKTRLEQESINRNAKLLQNQNEQNKILAIIAEAGPNSKDFDEAKLKDYNSQLELLRAQTLELERQADANARILDAGRQALETGLQGSISALLKGEESSIKDAMLGIMKGVTDSMIDAFSQNLTEKIMGFIPGYQTQEQKMKAAIQTGHTEGGEEAAKKQKDAMDQATTKFATAINEAADRFAAAIRDACSSSACMGHGGGGGGSTAATVATTVAEAVTPSATATAEPVFEESFKEKMDRLAVTRDLQLQDTQRAAEAAGLVSENLEKAAEETGEGGGFRGFFRKLIGRSAEQVDSGEDATGIVPEGKAGEGLEEVVGKGRKGTGIKGLFTNFTSNFGAIFDKNTEGGLLSKMGTLFGGLASDFGGIFGTLTEGLGSLFSGGGGFLGGLFGFASGGYTSKMRDYSTGGVAKGPRSGYPALLHGNEAVVPLPDGKSIPVTMPKTSAGGMQNNVGVTVNIDNQGGVSTDTQSDSQQATEIGERIAQLVQEELLNQKRNGGILSPFGVA